MYVCVCVTPTHVVLFCDYFLDKRMLAFQTSTFPSSVCKTHLLTYTKSGSRLYPKSTQRKSDIYIPTK